MLAFVSTVCHVNGTVIGDGAAYHKQPFYTLSKLGVVTSCGKRGKLPTKKDYDFFGVNRDFLFEF